MRISFKVGPLIFGKSLDGRHRPSEPTGPPPAYRGEGPVGYRPGAVFWVVMAGSALYLAFLLYGAMK